MTGFRWFSERVAEILRAPGEEALVPLRDLIQEAEAQKQAGYGPPQDDINQARRKWLGRFHELYGRAA